MVELTVNLPLSQVLRRVVSLALVASGMIRLGVGPVWQSGLLVLCGLATYFFWPRPLRPKGSYDMQALPAVIGPDLLGIALTSFFVALPLWIGRGQGGEGLHGSVLLLWPMALASVSLLVVGLRNTCLGLEIAQDCLVLTRFSGRSEILFDEISQDPPMAERLAADPARIASIPASRTSRGDPSGTRQFRDRTGTDRRPAAEASA